MKTFEESIIKVLVNKAKEEAKRNNLKYPDVIPYNLKDVLSELTISNENIEKALCDLKNQRYIRLDNEEICLLPNGLEYYLKQISKNIGL